LYFVSQKPRNNGVKGLYSEIKELVSKLGNKDELVFLLVVVGVIAILFPIILVLTLPSERFYHWSIVFAFTLLGLSTGSFGAYLIITGYHDLTEKLNLGKSERKRKIAEEVEVEEVEKTEQEEQGENQK
ncbi:hypothetical protein AKJ36_03535, partial [candidate division MSBL1 archaeon SCGC-AAA259I07]